MMRKSIETLVVAAMVGAATPASAALIEKNIVVTGTYDAGPYEKVVVNFNVRFDNSFDIAPTSDGLTIVESTLNYPLKYSYLAERDVFTLATSPGLGSYAVGADRYGVFLINLAGSRPFAGGGTFGISSGETFSPKTLSVSATALAGAVPEPSTWALMILGFGVVGYSMRRRQKVAVRFA